jgi:hypothetical protein
LKQLSDLAVEHVRGEPCLVDNARELKCGKDPGLSRRRLWTPLLAVLVLASAAAMDRMLGDDATDGSRVPILMPG